MTKSNGVRLHHKKKSDGVRLYHDRKSNGVRLVRNSDAVRNHYEKE